MSQGLVGIYIFYTYYLIFLNPVRQSTAIVLILEMKRLRLLEVREFP